MAALTAVTLDGSEGEGGGQILRSALTCSLVTGRPFTITKIRANRKPAGLRPQHLACVRGAEAISSSVSEGAAVSASELSFQPGLVKAGDYLLDVGTAGSTPLLLQCLLLPLALAGGGTLTLRGGTHLPKSPSYPYLSWIWLPLCRAFGVDLSLSMPSAGFYPRGGGELRAEIGPRGEPPGRVSLDARGALREVTVSSYVANLPFEIAERQSQAAARALRQSGIHVEQENAPLPSQGSQGTATFIRAQFENTAAGFTALGERGRRAEDVGREAAQLLSDFMGSAGALDEHLADQALVPAALLAAGYFGASDPGTTTFTTAAVTDHLTTNAKVLERFLPVSISVKPTGEVSVGKRTA